MKSAATCIVAIALIFGASASARQPDGTLGIIQTPNDGMPAILSPGMEFDVVLTKQGALRLTSEKGQFDLDAKWTALPGGPTRARCVVPTETPPGTYAIESTAADQTDKNPRAVFVRDAFPDSYIFAQLTDTHIGSQRSAKNPLDTLRAALDALNTSGAAFVLVTGDLTDTSEPSQFQGFLEALGTSAIPTFVCPGNHDREKTNYTSFFGPRCYTYRFGKDGYLSFDTKDFITADDLDEQNGELEVYRRAIKAARFSVGFTHRYEPEMGMRSQLALFVDDPLDILIIGHLHSANEDNGLAIPWNTTALTVTPAAVDGFARLFDVSPKGVKPRPPQRIVATE